MFGIDIASGNLNCIVVFSAHLIPNKTKSMISTMCFHVVLVAMVRRESTNKVNYLELEGPSDDEFVCKCLK